jgi:tetrahydromethanopterin S-methyltransferase subunit G
MRRALMALAVSLSGCGGCEPPAPLAPVESGLVAVSESVNGALADVSKRLDGLGERVGALQAQVDAWIPSVLARLDKVEKRLDAVENKDGFDMGEAK